MKKRNKLLTNTRGHFKGLLFFLLSCASLGLITGLIVGSQAEEDTIDPNENQLSREVESLSDTTEAIYSDNLSPIQIQEDVNHHLGFSPDFSLDLDETDDADIASSEELEDADIQPLLDEDETFELITAYLDGLLIQQQKYNRYIQSMSADLQYAETYDEDFLNSPEAIANWAHPLLDSMVDIMANTPLFMHSNDGTYRVFVDYDLVNTHYEDILSPFHTDMIRLHKDIARFGYNREDGRIDADILYHRLLIIDEIQELERSKDDFYWEEERYQLASLFVGYGTETRPTWDAERIQQLELIAANDVNNGYRDIAEALVKSIEKEGEYGSDTVRMVNDWMSAEFDDYLSFLESENKE